MPDPDVDLSPATHTDGAEMVEVAAPVSPEPTTDWVPDDAALAAYVDLARSALLDITPAETIGDPAGHVVEGDRLISVHFASVLPGYPGWRWTVSIAQVDAAEPTVLETELTPGDGALLAPDWTPWVDRLADYRTAQDAAAREAADAEAEAVAAAENEEASSDDHDLDDDLDDDIDDDIDDDDDEDDEDDEVGRVRSLLHSGDLDGVDIDDLDESDSDSDSDDSDAESGDSDAESDEADAGADFSGREPSGAATESVRVEESEQPEQDADAGGDEHPVAADGGGRPDEEE